MTQYFAPQDLKSYATRYLMRWGIYKEDAAIAADVLVSADMRGVDSHGMIRLQSYYGSRFANGQIDPNASLSDQAVAAVLADEFALTKRAAERR